MKLLLLIQNEADVAHLDAAAKAILNSAITGVWVVFSPAITVSASDVTAKLDAEIAQLRTAEQQAAQRTDYEAAAGYKTQREGKELDKAKAVNDAWKTVSADDRKARVTTIFQPFIGALQPKNVSVRITGHSDHYDREQWVAMLNSLSGVWFKPFTPGSFVVGWPESVERSIKVLGTDAWAETAKTIAGPGPAADIKQRLPEVPKPTLSREEELRGMKFMSLKAAAKKVGVDVEGKKTPQIVAEVLAAEQKIVPDGAPATPPTVAPEPSLSEY